MSIWILKIIGDGGCPWEIILLILEKAEFTFKLWILWNHGQRGRETSLCFKPIFFFGFGVLFLTGKVLPLLKLGSRLQKWWFQKLSAKHIYWAFNSYDQKCKNQSINQSIN